MKHLSAILALTILIFASLACSDSGDSTTRTNDNKTSATKTEDNTATKNDSADGVKIEWVNLYTDDGSGDEADEVTSFKPTDNPQHFT